VLDQRLRDQQFYTRLAQSSPTSTRLMTTDPQGIITDVNQQMIALTGRNAGRADRARPARTSLPSRRARRRGHQARADREQGEQPRG